MITTLVSCLYYTTTVRMPSGLCNAPRTFQRCVVAIFHDMIGKTIEVFMDDFLEKYHFIAKESVVLGYKIFKNGIEVDRAKFDVIAKLPPPTTVKGISSFLEFDIVIRDKKRAENLAAGHLSRLENPYKGDVSEMEMNDNFPHEICVDQVIRWCVDGKEAMDILEVCHHGPTRGHHGPNYTAKKVFDSGFFWPTIYRDAHDMVKYCDACEHRAKWDDKLDDAL
nr:hypothetical protein [Tanacetum cinerariifolium]